MVESQILMKVGFEIDVPELGQRIREARHRSSSTITQLAALADISVANWYAIEQERVKVLPINTLKRIEQVLGVKFEDRPELTAARHFRGEASARKMP